MPPPPAAAPAKEIADVDAAGATLSAQQPNPDDPTSVLPTPLSASLSSLQIPGSGGGGGGWPPPLAEAIPLEAYEAEMERRRAVEERAAAANPFDVLSVDEVKIVATETVVKALSSLTSEVERALEEQRQKFMVHLGKLPAV
ncbi:hypothetical protein HK104_002271 [Borealophlyctis nickersoniae]|nr:hypothetical protein HK104_002271 [Borealophlyctis nickersoniae]